LSFDYFSYQDGGYGEEDVRIRVDLDVKEFDRLFLPIQSRRLIHAYSTRRSARLTFCA
jgi:hypothetical protein